MAQRTQNPKPHQAETQRRKAEPLWLWIALILGSAVIHSVLVIMAIPLWHRLSAPEFERFAAVPIELVDLPPEPTASSQQTENQTALAAIAASPQPAPSRQATPAANQPVSAATPKLPQTVASAPTTAASSASPLPRSNPGANPSAQPESTAPADTEAAAPGVTPPDRSTETTETEATPGNTASPSPQPTPTATPGFATIPIDLPTPDVSETLALPSSSPTPLAQVEVDRENMPVHLTVSLDLERIPVEKSGDNPDRLAAPQEGVERREISTMDESACAGALKPEIMQALGTKVALQVSTDVTGQVTQIAAQVPSRNAAYNELTRCLVQHWGFVPAQAGGEPVSSNALLVWITIEQS